MLNLMDLKLVDSTRRFGSTRNPPLFTAAFQIHLALNIETTGSLPTIPNPHIFCSPRSRAQSCRNPNNQITSDSCREKGARKTRISSALADLRRKSVNQRLGNRDGRRVRR